jgi:hypothetical protein
MEVLAVEVLAVEVLAVETFEGLAVEVSLISFS